MTVIVEATYENGVFKPVHPLDLPEGTQVALMVTTSDEQTQTSPADFVEGAQDLTFREILAPLHREIQESGMTDEDLDALFEEARNSNYQQERRSEITEPLP